MRICAIDPGANGGVAWREADGLCYCAPMPDTPGDLCQLLTEIAPNVCYVERTGGYMPGNSGPAAVKFARHCGMIDGLLLGLNIPRIAVAPAKWMTTVCGALPKEKKDRKNAIKAAMQARFPVLKATLKTADALGILCYAMKEEG